MQRLSIASATGGVGEGPEGPPIVTESATVLAALILSCIAPQVYDGLHLRRQGKRVRLAGIDRPQIAKSCRGRHG